MRFLPLFLAAALLTGCGPSPIIRASANGRNDEVSSLLARGANIEDRPIMGCWTYYPKSHPLHAGLETPLICATINHHPDTVKLLLEKGADVYMKDYEGKTALDYASSPAERDDAIVALLTARMQGRPLETAVAPPPPEAEAEAKPAAQKQWYDK